MFNWDAACLLRELPSIQPLREFHPRQTLGKAVLGGEDKKLPPLLNQKEKQWIGSNGLGCLMCTSCCVLTQWWTLLMDIVSENLCGTSVDLTWCCGLLSGRWYFRTLLWDEVTHCPVTGYKRGVIGKKLIDQNYKVPRYKLKKMCAVCSFHML